MKNFNEIRFKIGIILVQCFYILILYANIPTYAQTNVTILPGASKNFSKTVYNPDATSYGYSVSTPFFITFTNRGVSRFTTSFLTVKFKLSVSPGAPSGTYPVTVKYTFNAFPYSKTWEYNVTTGFNSVEDENPSLPLEFSLNQNYPNPFNSTTTITYNLPESNKVLLRVFDINGKLVKVLVDEKQLPGVYHVKWDGTTSEGHAASTGLYFYQLIAGKHVVLKKMILTK